MSSFYEELSKIIREMVAIALIAGLLLSAGFQVVDIVDERRRKTK